MNTSITEYRVQSIEYRKQKLSFSDSLFYTLVMKRTPFLDYILYDIFGEGEPIVARAMMGAYILYYEGKAFAIVEREELYFKGSKELASWYVSRGSKQFRVSRPRGLAVNKSEGKDAHLYYFLVPLEVYEDKKSRDEWMDVALSVAKLPGKQKAKSK